MADSVKIVPPGVTIDPVQPRYPDRVCWGCDRHCPAGDLACGEDKSRAPHPSELCGKDWFVWETERSQHDHANET